MKLQNKVIVVSGAGGGIGGALVHSLIKRGAIIAALDLKLNSLQKLQADAADKNRLSIHALNISDRSAVSALPDEIQKIHGQIDGVINCAGIVQPFVRINDLDYDVIERVMNVNFYGTLYLTKAFLPVLLERPEAYIVNVSSMGGFLPVPGQSIYGASKAAIKLMSEGLFAELSDTNVHVSTVFPGGTKTNITENSGVKAPVASADAEQQKYSMLTADEAAEIIVRGMERNKPLIYTGKDSHAMNRLYRLNPVFATKLIARKMRSLLD